MLYEFTLAQLISLFFGSTFEIYALTIGVYTFSLGMGALYYEWRVQKKTINSIFFKTELALSLTALLAPFAIVVLSTQESFELLGFFSKILAFVPVFFCGWFSGIELPCLIDLSSKNSDQKVLFVDFFGMFVGCICFSVFLIDALGPVTLIWSLCFTNIVILLLFLFLKEKDIILSHWFIGSSALMLICLCLYFEREITLFFKGVHGV